MLSLLYFLAFRFKSYNVCTVKPIHDYYTLQLCRTAARHFEANFSMSNWRIGPRKQVKRGKQCLVGQFCQWHSYWRRLAIKFSHEPKIVLQISWHPDTWTVNFDLNTDSKYVWTWKVLNPQRKICGFKNICIRAHGKGTKPSRHQFFSAGTTSTTKPFIFCPWDKRFVHDQNTNSIEPSHVYLGHAIPANSSF